MRTDSSRASDTMRSLCWRASPTIRSACALASARIRSASERAWLSSESDSVVAEDITESACALASCSSESRASRTSCASSSSPGIASLMSSISSSTSPRGTTQPAVIGTPRASSTMAPSSSSASKTRYTATPSRHRCCYQCAWCCFCDCVARPGVSGIKGRELPQLPAHLRRVCRFRRFGGNARPARHAVRHTGRRMWNTP
jgi:hypothetical protein